MHFLSRSECIDDSGEKKEEEREKGRARPNTSQFESLEIRRSTFLSHL